MMTDREKVVKGLDCCIKQGEQGILDCDYDCPYGEHGNRLDCWIKMNRDALALLKEPVPQGVVDQIRWERDTALSQLEEIGKGLGEKMDDIVSMLKEQEAVEPEWFDGTPFCGNCGHRLEKKNRNMKEIKCPTCERSVKWE